VVSTELVGPVPTIRFRAASRYESPRQQYVVPTNTLDPRWKACTDHHPGCDCREAELNEQIAELRAEEQALAKTVAQVLRGHPTWAYETDPRTGREFDVSCQCTGCQIARAAHLRLFYSLDQDRFDSYRERFTARNGHTS
jgi:hypothetical protein